MAAVLGCRENVMLHLPHALCAHADGTVTLSKSGPGHKHTHTRTNSKSLLKSCHPNKADVHVWRGEERRGAYCNGSVSVTVLAYCQLWDSSPDS